MFSIKLVAGPGFFFLQNFARASGTGKISPPEPGFAKTQSSLCFWCSLQIPGKIKTKHPVKGCPFSLLRDRDFSSSKILRVPPAQAKFLLQNPGSQKCEAVHISAIPCKSRANAKTKTPTMGVFVFVMLRDRELHPGLEVMSLARYFSSIPRRDCILFLRRRQENKNPSLRMARCGFITL